MRTVSFSDRNVRNLLNKNFINTFTNTTGDPTAGRSIWHQPDDSPGQCARGVGSQNVQTIFMTSEGKIFHAANGYLSAKDLLEEVHFAKDLFAQIEDSEGSAEDLVRQVHEDRLEELGFDAQEIDEAKSGKAPSAFGFVPQVNSGNIFEGKTRRAQLMGNAFSIKHPLMDYRKFEKDPTPLVGRGKSAFVSISCDGRTPANRSKTLGGDPESNKQGTKFDETSGLLERLRKQR